MLYTAQDLIEYEQLFTPYRDDLALARTIEVGLSEIKLRHQLYQRDAQGVIEALTKTEL